MTNGLSNPQKDGDLGLVAPSLAAPPAPQQDAAAPAATPVEKIDMAPQSPPGPVTQKPATTDDLPPPSLGNPVPPDMDASTGDVIGAAWQAETIRTDAWGDTQRRRSALAQEMWGKLPEASRVAIIEKNAARYGDPRDWAGFADLVLGEARKQAEAAPEAARLWGTYPLTMQDFEARITDQRRAEYDTAQAILDQPGGGLAEFAGAGARAMTDEASLLMLPLGFGGGSAARVILSEAALGAAGEAAVLPREYRVAKELDLADPDAVTRITLGAVAGGALSGAVLGAGKVLAARRARQAGNAAAAQGWADDLQAELAIDDAEASMAGMETVKQRLDPDQQPAPPPQPGTLGAVLQGQQFSSVVEAGKGYTVVRTPDGKTVRRDGTRAWRNNNPGNIEYGNFAIANGAIGSDGRFAVFPSYAAGRRAKANLLFGSRGYRGLTIGQAIGRYAPDFENDTRAYTSAITRAIGAKSDTPLAALSPAQRELMLSAMEKVEGFRPGRENGVQAAAPSAGQRLPDYAPTSRGYTSSGQVRVGDDMVIDVEYQVVDAADLRSASGDLQPRDRSQINSDVWIAETAARLDPMQLGRSPNAATGAPIVGPDDVVESGNGRLGVIRRAYAQHPDRAQAYRAFLEAEGFAVPEGMREPVLVARRKTELDDGQRKRLVVDAQDSGVAVMRPIEMAKANARAMTDAQLALYRGDLELDAPENAAFVRGWQETLSKATRNAVGDGENGLNSYGRKMLREAIFARAWPDDDLIDMMTEGASGELKSLMDALVAASPDWALLRADVAAGRIGPEFDLTEHVLGAMQAIVGARKLARANKQTVAAAMADLLASPDLLDGAIPPVTLALLRKFWRNGRAASAEDIADFLGRYAREARRANDAKGGFFDAPSPVDVLQAMDRETFGDLPDDLAAAFGAKADAAAPAPEPLVDAGFDAGAASPEAEVTGRAMAEDTPADPAADAVTPGMDLRAEFGDMEIEFDGAKWTAREVLDDLEADDAADAVLEACGIGGAA